MPSKRYTIRVVGRGGIITFLDFADQLRMPFLLVSMGRHYFGRKALREIALDARKSWEPDLVYLRLLIRCDEYGLTLLHIRYGGQISEGFYDSLCGDSK